MVAGTAGLQEDKITPQTLLNCPPYINVNGWIYHNWASYSLGWMNVARALATSCDTFFYQVAAMVGDVTLARYARAHGFGQAKAIEMPGVMPVLGPDRGRAGGWWRQDRHRAVGWQRARPAHPRVVPVLRSLRAVRHRSVCLRRAR